MQENRIMRFHTEGSFSMIHGLRKTRLNMVIRKSAKRILHGFYSSKYRPQFSIKHDLNYTYGHQVRIRN